MKNGQNLFTTLALAAVILLASSCEISSADVFPFGRKSSQSIKVNVSSPSNYSETKSDSDYVLTHTFGDDEFSISEYVSDIEDVMDIQETKGAIITTTGINSADQSFTVDGWGMVSPGKGKPQVLTNHLPKLAAKYNSSGSEHWPWADGANPKWVKEANLHIWSYYPVGKINPTITIDDATDTNNTAVFSYTTDNTDLLIAYNKEYREFEKDAAGNHTYDDDGVITNPMVTGQSESFNVHFYHALAAIEFELSDQMKTDKVDVKKITITTSDGGFYTTGNCTVTGPSLAAPTTGAGTGGVVWSTTGQTKGPVVCEFTPVYPYPTTPTTVATGLASTGSGVLFMIPQGSETTTATIEVEFCKYGGGSVTRTQTIPAGKLKWQAGKYYKYVFDGEIHVPGEPLLGTVELVASNFKFPETRTPTIIDRYLPIKGVTKIGLIMDGYTYKDNQASTLVMTLAKNGSSERYVANVKSGENTTFDFNFKDTNMEKPATGSVIDVNKIYTFGINNTDPETYHRYYEFNGQNGTITNTDTWYFVFDIPENYDTNPSNDITTFNITVVCTSNNNSAKFTANIRSIMVLEVKNN